MQNTALENCHKEGEYSSCSNLLQSSDSGIDIYNDKNNQKPMIKRIFFSDTYFVANNHKRDINLCFPDTGKLFFAWV